MGNNIWQVFTKQLKSIYFDTIRLQDLRYTTFADRVIIFKLAVGKLYDNSRFRNYTVNKNKIKCSVSVYLFIYTFFSNTFASVSVKLVETQKSFFFLFFFC